MDAVIEKLFECEDQRAPEHFLQRFHKLKTLKRVLPTSKQAFVRDVTSYFPGVDNLADLLESFFDLEYESVEAAVKARQGGGAVAEASTEATGEGDAMQESEALQAGGEEASMEQDQPVDNAQDSDDLLPVDQQDDFQQDQQEADQQMDQSDDQQQQDNQQQDDQQQQESEGQQRESAADQQEAKEEAREHRHAQEDQATADAKATQEAMKDEESNAQPSSFTSSVSLTTRKEGGMSQALLTQHKTYNVWIGDLAGDATEEDLREAFKNVGGVKSVRCFKDKQTGKNRGFGFVHFVDRESQKAVLRSDFDAPSIKGRRCRVGPSAERVTLYIGGLPDTSNTEKVLEEMSKLIGSDNIASLEVKVTDEGKCRGFGFLQLTDQHTAYNCLRKLQQNTVRIEDRTVTISWAEPDEDPSQATSKTVYMSNLDKTLTEDAIKDACKCYGPVVKVTISKDQQTNQPRGYCFVEFDRRNDALKAITALHNTKLGDNYVQASIAKPRGAPKGGYPQGGSGGPRDMRPSGGREPYGNYRSGPPPPPRRGGGRGGYHDSYASRPAPRDYGRDGGYGGGYDYGRGGDYYRDQGGSYGGGYDGYGGGYGGYSSSGGYGGGYGSSSQSGYGGSQGGYGGGYGGSQGGYDGYGGSGGYDRGYGGGGPQRSGRGGSGQSRYNPY